MSTWGLRTTSGWTKLPRNATRADVYSPTREKLHERVYSCEFLSIPIAEEL